MTVSYLHSKAMDVAESAFMQKMRGNLLQARDLFVEAFELERDAAMQLEKDLESEPTRSILFRSAASLAMNAGDFHSAEKMIAMGLAGDPPEDIAEELRNLILELYLARKPEPAVSNPPAVPVVLTGRLGYADESRNRVRLIDERGKKTPYILEINRDFTETVQRFWGKHVKVTGLSWKDSRRIQVEDIEKAAE